MTNGGARRRPTGRQPADADTLGGQAGTGRVARPPEVRAAVRGDVVHGLGEQPDRGRGLGLGHDERRRHPDAVVAGLEDEQPAVERLHLDRLGRLAGVELDPDHQALAADVADEPREAVQRAARGRP